jgi:hypothetical protein
MNSLITVLAAARLTSLVAEDELTQPIRNAVDDWAQVAPDSSLRNRLAYLVSCSRCVSVWAGAGILLAQTVPAARPLVKVLALSQAALGALTVLDAIERR